MPCIRIISGHITVQSILDGDAEIEGSYVNNRTGPPPPHPNPRPKKTKNQPHPTPSIPQFPNEYCHNWSAGKCTGATCPNGRIHGCENCGGPHFAKNHKAPAIKKKGGKDGKGGKGGKGGKVTPPTKKKGKWQQ